jgi:peptidyl-tRNA hydrolase, PTH1 family
MIVFFGLGNHEPQYLATKHNLGRVVVEQMAQGHAAGAWTEQQGCSSARCMIHGVQCVLLHSNQYMNTSGVQLREWLSYYKINFGPDSGNQLVVLHDDSDQQEGHAKLVQGGGSAGQKGIDSVYAHIASLGIPKPSLLRLKIGIRPPGNTLKSETFVLTRLSALDMQWAQSIATLLTSKKILAWLTGSELQKAITAVNSLTLDQTPKV